MKSPRVLLAAADRQELCGQVVAAVQRGDLVALPTETVYGLAMRPDLPLAAERVRALKGRDEAKEFTWHLADRADADALVATGDPRVQRLIQRYWPGPLTLVLPTPAGGSKGVRVPAHEFTRAVLRATGPLWLTSVNRSGEPPLCDPAAIEAQFGAQLALLVDDGVTPLGNASTVVRATGPQLEVLREGILSTREVLHTAAVRVLFVCTGNTCRSPMAEALARHEVAAACGVAPHDLLARGLSFASAGTGTLDDLPASEGSLRAMQDLGIDLAAHRSRSAARELLQRADRIYALASSHLRALRSVSAEAAARSELLSPDGQEIADPYGGDLADYRACRDEIRAAIAARAADWRALLPG